MTQADLASATGIALRTIANILGSAEIKTPEHLSQIAKALDVSEEWLTSDQSTINQTGHVNAIKSKKINTYGGDVNPDLIRLETENKMLREQLASMKELIENLTTKLTQRNNP